MSNKHKAPCRLVLFSGRCVDISGENIQMADNLDQTIRTIAISSSRIPRWNGHLRIPLSLFHEHGYEIDIHRTFTNGLALYENEPTILYVFYSVLNHLLLVDRIIEHWAEQGFIEADNVRHLRLQALFHEVGECIISDVPGPLKAIPEVRAGIKPVERRIEASLSQTLKVPFPWEPVIKSADILAQDIEGYFGYSEHHFGVNVSEDFMLEDWMEPALLASGSEGPVDFYNRVVSIF